MSADFWLALFFHLESQFLPSILTQLAHEECRGSLLRLRLPELDGVCGIFHIQHCLLF